MTSSGQQRSLARTPAFIVGAPVSVAVVAVAVVALIVGRGDTSTPVPNAGEVRSAVESAAEEHQRLIMPVLHQLEPGSVQLGSATAPSRGGYLEEHPPRVPSTPQVREPGTAINAATGETTAEWYIDEHGRTIEAILSMLGEDAATGVGVVEAPPAGWYVDEHGRTIEGTLSLLEPGD